MTSFTSSSEKIASIRSEFHEMNDLEIQPGLRILDLENRQEAHRAINLLSGEIDTIVRQIEVARLEHAKGKKILDKDWLLKAQTAIRWKRHVSKAIRTKMETLPKLAKPVDVKQVMLEVIQENIGARRMDELVAIAKARAAELGAAIEMPPFSVSAEHHDPLQEAIKQYKEANDRFCQLPDDMITEDEDAAIAQTYGPPMERLEAWDNPATTRASALAALQLIISERLYVDGMGLPMIRAAIGYLEQGASRPVDKSNSGDN